MTLTVALGLLFLGCLYASAVVVVIGVVCAVAGVALTVRDIHHDRRYAAMRATARQRHLSD